MTTKTYSEKLKDPRWQKKRLRVLERDGWKCQDCGDAENTLHVHHCLYVYGREPWEYPDEDLRTLCANCHEARPMMEGEVVIEFKKYIATKTSMEAASIMWSLFFHRTQGGPAPEFPHKEEE